MRVSGQCRFPTSGTDVETHGRTIFNSELHIIGMIPNIYCVKQVLTTSVVIAGTTSKISETGGRTDQKGPRNKGAQIPHGKSLMCRPQLYWKSF